jgi:hypothetical protein
VQLAIFTPSQRADLFHRFIGAFEQLAHFFEKPGLPRFQTRGAVLPVVLGTTPFYCSSGCSCFYCGVEDHVHLLCALPRTCSAADMVKEVKRSSSLWLKAKSPDLADFAWQNGYGIFSIGFSQIESVRDYIDGQEEHHRKVSFQDEFCQLLRRYEIEFDERYVWD